MQTLGCLKLLGIAGTQARYTRENTWLGCNFDNHTLNFLTHNMLHFICNKDNLLVEITNKVFLPVLTHFSDLFGVSVISVSVEVIVWSKVG